MHKSRLVPDWEDIGGIDEEATRRSAEDAVRVLRSAVWMCAKGGLHSEGDAARVIANFGSGSGSCTPTVESTKRARMWASVRDRLLSR